MYDCVLEPLFRDGDSAQSVPPQSRNGGPDLPINLDNDNHHNNHHNIVLQAPSPDIPRYAWRSLTPLILGRNATTRIALVNVSRQVCQLQWRPPPPQSSPVTRRRNSRNNNTNSSSSSSSNNTNNNNNNHHHPTQWVVRAMGCQEHSEFFVNGRCFQGTASVELQENDILSLYRTPDTGTLEFQYKVRFLIHHPPPPLPLDAAAAAAANTTTTTANALHSSSRKRRAYDMDASFLSDHVVVPDYSQTTQAEEECYDDDDDDHELDEHDESEYLEYLEYLEEDEEVIVVDNDDNDNNEAAVQANLVGAVHDELCCAICLDIMVQSTLCVPCGHSFCQSCLAHQTPSSATTTTTATTTTCPTCRRNITGTVPNRQLDNVIGLVMPSLADDDQEHYRDRLTALHLPVPTILTKPLPHRPPPPERARPTSACSQCHHCRRQRHRGNRATTTNTVATRASPPGLRPLQPWPSGTSAEEAILID